MATGTEPAQENKKVVCIDDKAGDNDMPAPPAKVNDVAQKLNEENVPASSSNNDSSSWNGGNSNDSKPQNTSSPK
jgi:hypothetical protein